MPEDWLIYPLVRRIVGELAKLCNLLLICSAAGIAGVLLYAAGASDLGGSLWLLADSLLPLHLFLLAVLMLWSHEVLLSGRGTPVSRFLLLLSVLLAGLYVVCTAYTVLGSGALLLPLQELTPGMVWALLSAGLLLNTGNMAALPGKWKWLMFCYLLLLLVVLLTRNTELLLIAEAGKILCALCGFPLFRGLARLAPQVVSLPTPQK